MVFESVCRGLADKLEKVGGRQMRTYTRQLGIFKMESPVWGGMLQCVPATHNSCPHLLLSGGGHLEDTTAPCSYLGCNVQITPSANAVLGQVPFFDKKKSWDAATYGEQAK
jgi:hypothetical protein|mmetsp:Transcript_25679/g.43732  ORF Transcript_25679/g.43732 Transcript_25679/m.43732 type:complete len:111 (+) Transcript_25679:321-653(+)